MKSIKLILFLCILLLINLNMRYSDQGDYLKTFTPAGNSIIPLDELDPYEGDQYNTSDPALLILNVYFGELEHLIIVPSCDLPARQYDGTNTCANYPMATTFFYAIHMTRLSPSVDYL